MTLSTIYATEYNSNKEHIDAMLDGDSPVEFDLTDPTEAGGIDIRLLLLREMQMTWFLGQARKQGVLGDNVIASIENVQALGYENLLDAITDNAGDEQEQHDTKLVVAMTVIAFQQYFIAHLGDDLLVLPAIKSLPLPDPKPFMIVAKSLH